MSTPNIYEQNHTEAEQRKFPKRIILLCGLSCISCLAYTILAMNFYKASLFERWIEVSQPAVNIVYSILPAHTDLRTHESISAIGETLKPMVQTYGFSWIIGFSFLVPMFLFSLFNLRDYYVEVSLPAYPKKKPLIDHVAWRFIGLIGCWVAAAYGGELEKPYLRTFYASLFVPLTFYYALGFIASLLAHFRFRKSKKHRFPRSA